MKLRTVTSIATALTLVLFLGCSKTTVQGPDGKKLTLVKPTDQSVVRGETNKVMVTISRSNFRDAVTVKVEDLPAGVKIQETDLKIAQGDNTVSFTLLADADAKVVANHVAKVVVTGPDNMQATETFKVTVKDKA
jgi:hypothetical protein